MRKLLVALSVLLLLVVVAGVLLLRGFASSPLPAPAELAGTLPPASPPPGMAVYRLPTGYTERSAAFAYRGGSFSEARDFTMSAALVQHPRGDLLIDAGFGSRIDEQIEQLPAPLRWMTSHKLENTAAERLERAGYAFGDDAKKPGAKKLFGVLLTHAHWDHVSGLSDLPGVPVLLTSRERAFIRDGGFVTAVARGIRDARWLELPIDGGAYLGFPQSQDLYGDGSVVVVPAPGHTPGSVIVFVTPPGDRRYAFVGDLVWQREGIELREERPWLLRRLADSNEELVRENLLRMAAIARRFPQIRIVPAHDSRAFEELPLLSAAASTR